MKRERVALYLTEDQHKELKSFCAAIGVSMSYFCDIAIRDRMKKEIKKQNEKK